MRSRFDEQLLELHSSLLRMGALCESAIESCAGALSGKKANAFLELSTLGTDISRQEREIENLCLRLLLQQQPVARDLRKISAALKMITDLSRIGQQAADIGEILASASGPIEVKSAPGIEEMAREAKAMLTQSIDAFVREDPRLADQAIRRDDVVDGLFEDLKAALAAGLRQGQEDAAILDLLMIAKYLERIADHAVNIAAWVEFSITGIHRRET